MHLENLINLKDQDLLTHFSMVVQKEREAIATVVSYLSEIDRRKLYLKEAYASLFSYVTQKFHYSEGAAYRRIQASKVNQLFPEVLDLLSKGKVSLMTLSLIEPHLTQENGKELIEKIIGKSKREVEGILSGLFGKEERERDIIRRLPMKRVKIEQGEVNVFTSGNTETSCSSEAGETGVSGTFTSESVEASCSSNPSISEKAVMSDPLRRDESKGVPKPKEQAVRRIKIEFVAEEGLAGKIERAKEILRHKFPEGKFEDIFNQALDDMLEKRDPKKKIERADKRKGRKDEAEGQIERSEVVKVRAVEKKPTKPLSRYISQEVKRRVWERDGGQCSFQSPVGRRCEARGFLQYDHVQPWALFGKSTEENLRLLCGQHNRWRTEATFKFEAGNKT